jgi:hypothetical protein
MIQRTRTIVCEAFFLLIDGNLECSWKVVPAVLPSYGAPFVELLDDSEAQCPPLVSSEDYRERSIKMSISTSCKCSDLFFRELCHFWTN